MKSLDRRRKVGGATLSAVLRAVQTDKRNARSVCLVRGRESIVVYGTTSQIERTTVGSEGWAVGDGTVTDIREGYGGSGRLGEANEGVRKGSADGARTAGTAGRSTVDERKDRII